MKSQAKYICYDCGRTTGAVMLTRRYPYADKTLDIKTFVCRTGTGCKKATG